MYCGRVIETDADDTEGSMTAPAIISVMRNFLCLRICTISSHLLLMDYFGGNYDTLRKAGKCGGFQNVMLESHSSPQ